MSSKEILDIYNQIEKIYNEIDRINQKIAKLTKLINSQEEMQKVKQP